MKNRSIRAPGRRRRRILVTTAFILAFLTLALLVVDGWSYYTTPYANRPHHPDYRELRPAGSRGLMYGIVGASMMVLMLVYSLQKRLRLFGRRWPLRPFLDFHIFLGVMGPLLIVLHTSFKVQGLVAIAFWSMIAVALSGYLGRYLYQQIPRNMDDQELTLAEIESRSGRLFDELRHHTSLDDATLSGILKAYEDAYTAHATNLLSLVLGLFVKDLKRPWMKRRLRRTVTRLRILSRRETDTMVELATQRALLKRRLLVLGRIHRLFDWWHVIHKPFAVIMYIIMIVHIGVAVWTGYAWY